MSDPEVYEVSVRGELGAAMLSAFPALSAASQGGVTLLSGVLLDQAALYGVLGQLESLGLELLGVRRHVGGPRSFVQAADAPVLDTDRVQ